MLTIEGNKRSSREASGRAYYFSERTYGAFRRVFRLPADVDKDGIVASMEDGVLTIVLPKKEASNDATRKIVIRNTGTANL